MEFPLPPVLTPCYRTMQETRFILHGEGSHHYRSIAENPPVDPCGRCRGNQYSCDRSLPICLVPGSFPVFDNTSSDYNR